MLAIFTLPNVESGENRWLELPGTASQKDADPRLYHTQHNRLRSKITALYEKAKAAMDNIDAQAYLDLLYDDFVFVRHQTCCEVTKAELAPTLTAMMESAALETSNERCIYENDDIIVSHQFLEFPHGTSKAVMIVNMKKIW